MKKKPASKKPKTATEIPNIDELTRKAFQAGVDAGASAVEKAKMPPRFPNDPEPVRLLLDESERLAVLGNRWLNAEAPNFIAAESCLRNGWAFSLAGAWLRCKFNRELAPGGLNKKETGPILDRIRQRVLDDAMAPGKTSDTTRLLLDAHAEIKRLRDALQKIATQQAAPHTLASDLCEQAKQVLIGGVVP